MKFAGRTAGCVVGVLTFGWAEAGQPGSSSEALAHSVAALTTAAAQAATAEILVLGALLAASLVALAWALHSRNRHRRLCEYYEKCFYETRDSLDMVATALGQRRFLSLMRLGCERAAAANARDE